jgi:hypothetical protein
MAPTEKGFRPMQCNARCKAFVALRLLLVALLFAAGGTQTGGLDLFVQQIRTLGPRQWLGLMAGSIVSGTPVIAPLTQHIARALPGRSDSGAADNVVASTIA